MNENVTYDFFREVDTISKEKMYSGKWNSNMNIDNDSDASMGNKTFSLNNAVKLIPMNIILKLNEETYGTGMKVPGEDFFCNLLSCSQGSLIVNNAVSGLYTQAVANKKRNLAFNIVLLYSHLPYDELGDVAQLMAMGMTRSPYPEVQEMAIQCFENWGDRSAGKFLAECKFVENWLQKYADEVCKYLRVEGKDVLFTKNKSWKVDYKEWSGVSSNISQGCESRCHYGRTEIFGR